LDVKLLESEGPQMKVPDYNHKIEKTNEKKLKKIQKKQFYQFDNLNHK